jgi:hypothetical protein
MAASGAWAGGASASPPPVLNVGIGAAFGIRTAAPRPCRPVEWPGLAWAT